MRSGRVKKEKKLLTGRQHNNNRARGAAVGGENLQVVEPPAVVGRRRGVRGVRVGARAALDDEGPVLVRFCSLVRHRCSGRAVR